MSSKTANYVSWIVWGEKLNFAYLTNELFKKLISFACVHFESFVKEPNQTIYLNKLSLTDNHLVTDSGFKIIFKYVIISFKAI